MNSPKVRCEVAECIYNKQGKCIKDEITIFFDSSCDSYEENPHQPTEG